MSWVVVFYKMGREEKENTYHYHKRSDYETMKSGVKGENVSIFHSSFLKSRQFFSFSLSRPLRLDRAFVSFESRKIN
jgi:hypothetical protein